MSVNNCALSMIIHQRILGDMRLSGVPIDVCCSDGQVCLTGMVESDDQKRIAMELVVGVLGVRDVVDKLTIKWPARTVIINK